MLGSQEQTGQTLKGPCTPSKTQFQEINWVLKNDPSFSLLKTHKDRKKFFKQLQPQLRPLFLKTVEMCVFVSVSCFVNVLEHFLLYHHVGQASQSTQTDTTSSLSTGKTPVLTADSLRDWESLSLYTTTDTAIYGNTHFVEFSLLSFNNALYEISGQKDIALSDQ